MSNLLDRALHYVGKNKKNTYIVQVGAMDGVSFDDVRGYIDMYKWNGLFVEPMSDLHAKLVASYGDRASSCRFEQSAITSVDGPVEMVRINPLDIITHDLPAGFGGMSSIFPPRNGLGTEYDRPTVEKYGEKLTVNGITLETLFAKHNIQSFDIFLVDAEGHDWVIFKQLDLARYAPKIIRLEVINLTKEELEFVKEKLTKHNYVFEVSGQDIDAISPELQKEMVLPTKKSDLTVVTGLWNINRPGRSFDHYIERFRALLDTDCNMFIYIPKEYEYIVWEKRTKVNTVVKIYEFSDLMNMYKPFWDKTQKIRTDPTWYGQAGWLKDSPQAACEWYNPIVMSKIPLLHDVTIWNPFGTNYFIWLDAGITHTVYENYFTKNKVLDEIIPYLSPFLFLCYPYVTTTEIHGFKKKDIDRHAGADVKMVARGGLFGGTKDSIHEANGLYYTLVENTLSEGLMGTEESIFAIMSYLYPETYRRYMLDENGLVVKFVQAVLDKTAVLEPIPNDCIIRKQVSLDLTNIKASVYILTFNFPQQLRVLLKSLEKYPEWLEKTDKILIDNSTSLSAQTENQEIVKEYGFTHYKWFNNIGINGGRMYAAEHFQKSNSDFYYFFEDDMCLHEPNNTTFCRNGFRNFVPDLFNKTQKIMLKESFDFLKLSFTEVYMDNHIQCSWYNVPVLFRKQKWPGNDKLPVSGHSPFCPRTKFDTIDNLDGLSYISGEVYYANWPMIVSKAGNQKMFLDTKWDHPFEQTWMSHMFQETCKGNIKAAVLLAAPINHNRIIWYKPEERREN